MSNKHMKRHSASLIIKEIQNKSIVRCHDSPPMWLRGKSLATPSIGDNGVKWNTHTLLGIM